MQLSLKLLALFAVPGGAALRVHLDRVRHTVCAALTDRAALFLTGRCDFSPVNLRIWSNLTGRMGAGKVKVHLPLMHQGYHTSCI